MHDRHQGKFRAESRSGFHRWVPAMAMLGLAVLPPVAVAASSASGRASESPPEAAWVETYAPDEDAWYQHQDLAACAGGMTLGLLEEGQEGGVSAPPSDRMWLYRVAADGALLETLEVPKPPAGHAGAPESVALVENMKVECGTDGGAVVAFNFPESVPWWIELDSRGAVLSSLRLGGTDFQMKLTDLVREPGGGYLLLGFDARAAIALRLDAAGRVGSEMVRDHGERDAFVGGCARADGGLMLVANSLTDDTAAPLPGVWLSAYDAEGALEREVRLPGRFGTVAAWAAGGGTLVYDRSTEGGQSIWAVTFDADLEPVGEIEISDAGGTLALPYAARMRGDGALFVLGNRWDHAQLTKIDAGGRRAWTVFGRDWGRSLDFHLGIDESGDAYVLLSRFVQGNSGFRKRITLAKVAE